MSKYGSYVIIYPKLDEEQMQWLEPSPEILVQHGSHYFFSPGFKTSDLVVDSVLKRYCTKDSFLKKIKSAWIDEKVITRLDKEKDKKNNERIQNILEMANRHFSEEVKPRDILAYYKDMDGTENFYLLTKKYLFSDYRDDAGEYINVLIKDVVIKEQGIYDLQGERLVKGGAFSGKFINLFKEIKTLGETVELTNYEHPLRTESLENRINYVSLLVAECFYDASLSANEVIRLETLARQLGVSSVLVVEKMQEAIKQQKENNSEYLSWALKKINDIPERYYYVLFHDVITFELLTSAEVEHEKESTFTNRLSERCDLDKNFITAYRNAIQSFVHSSYEIRTMMETYQNRIQDNIVNNIFESISFEYYMQEEMLRR